MSEDTSIGSRVALPPRLDSAKTVDPDATNQFDPYEVVARHHRWTPVEKVALVVAEGAAAAGASYGLWHRRQKAEGASTKLPGIGDGWDKSAPLTGAVRHIATGAGVALFNLNLGTDPHTAFAGGCAAGIGWEAGETPRDPRDAALTCGGAAIAAYGVWPAARRAYQLAQTEEDPTKRALLKGFSNVVNPRGHALAEAARSRSGLGVGVGLIDVQAKRQGGGIDFVPGVVVALKLGK